MGQKPVVCPSCQGVQVGKRGKTDTGTQRYRGHHPEGEHHSFRLDAASTGRLPAIKQPVVERRRNGSGSRDTARVLQLSPATGMRDWKQKGRPSQRSIRPS